jgi:hypothetical protein
MWNLWWTAWHWDRLFSEFFGFSLSKSFHRVSLYLYVTWGLNNRPVFGRNSETSSHPIDINKWLQYIIDYETSNKVLAEAPDCNVGYILCITNAFQLCFGICHREGPRKQKMLEFNGAN